MIIGTVIMIQDRSTVKVFWVSSGIGFTKMECSSIFHLPSGFTSMIFFGVAIPVCIVLHLKGPGTAHACSTGWSFLLEVTPKASCPTIPASLVFFGNCLELLRWVVVVNPPMVVGTNGVFGRAGHKNRGDQSSTITPKSVQRSHPTVDAFPDFELLTDYYPSALFVANEDARWSCEMEFCVEDFLGKRAAASPVVSFGDTLQCQATIQPNGKPVLDLQWCLWLQGWSHPTGTKV